MDDRIPTGTAPRDVKIALPPDPQAMAAVRDRVAAYAREAGMSREELGDFVTAISEALANAIEHAHTSSEIELTCRLSDGAVIATVTDRGIGFLPESDRPASDFPPANVERGRGMSIMRCCTDIFAVVSEVGKGTSVVLGRYVEQSVEGLRTA